MPKDEQTIVSIKRGDTTITLSPDGTVTIEGPVNYICQTFSNPIVCNDKDNDCDGKIDEGEDDAKK